jgi:hypothetical protein
MGVVRQACRALGGELEVSSRPGEGTRVSISWSAAQFAFARTASPYSFSQPQGGPLSGSREQYVEGGF